MVKIPATAAGIPAIRQAIAAGININCTLIFSLARYAEVIEAYFQALEQRARDNQPIDRTASVASFFVSRVDTKVDKRLEAIIQAEGAQAEQARALLGKAAIANAKLAYAQFQDAFIGDRFARLRARGARPQRPLWASTSTKNPAYRDVMYVEELIGADTVNTVPPQTLQAFADHAEIAPTLEKGLDEARRELAGLEDLGVSMDEVTAELEREGVKAFADAFTALLEAIEARRAEAAAQLGPIQAGVARRVEQLEAQHTTDRIFAADPNLWTEDPNLQTDIRQRLGWLNLPTASQFLVSDLAAFTSECRAAGLSHALLLGMGGSSLAPEVMRLAFGVAPGYLDLEVLDSTDPRQVRAAEERAPLDKTLVIVSSKSGTTTEVTALLEYFWARAREQLGDRAHEHFAAITDPGTPLEKLARDRQFRRVFAGEANVGGRYSALTAFGLMPAALSGVDVEQLLKHAEGMAKQCAVGVPAARNPGLVLGAALGQAALEKRDKLTLISDPALSPLGAWLEQLIAESSGKQGRGILPVEGEALLPPERYGADRLFVYLRHNGVNDADIAALQAAGHPALVLQTPVLSDLGAEFFRWEFATAVACAVLGINAFDQPDVQDSKNRASAAIKAFAERGSLDEGEPVWRGENAWVYGALPAELAQADSLKALLEGFLAGVKPGEYVAISAYLPRNPMVESQLGNFRRAARERTGAATTLGFGPRFLHSTGQFHKGGPDNGVFIQITDQPVFDLAIPGLGLTFGTLERAQALGDLQALQARNRRVIRVHLLGGLEELL
jgi:transaldolase/glucose-6-phosphate isomerase